MTEEQRPDVLAYIKQASLLIADEQDFFPVDAGDMDRWVMDNRLLIIARASELQWELLHKLNRHGIMDQVKKIICDDVYKRINARGEL